MLSSLSQPYDSQDVSRSSRMHIESREGSCSQFVGALIAYQAYSTLLSIVKGNIPPFLHIR